MQARPGRLWVCERVSMLAMGSSWPAGCEGVFGVARTVCCHVCDDCVWCGGWRDAANEEESPSHSHGAEQSVAQHQQMEIPGQMETIITSHQPIRSFSVCCPLCVAASFASGSVFTPTKYLVTQSFNRERCYFFVISIHLNNQK